MNEIPREISNLVELLHWRSEHQSSQRACTFLAEGETEEPHLTYGELDRQARAIGHWLQTFGAAGTCVLLLYPPSLDYIAAFFGCLYAGAIAVPAYPPRLNRTDPRLEAVVKDSQATVVLTTQAIFSKLETRFAFLPALATLRWLATDELPHGLEAEWHLPELNHESLAFLQYTSGSTSTPKGVMVSHGNLMHNERMIEKGFEHDQPVVVSWLPVYHDMGLIGNILQPLYRGGSTVCMSPTAFLQRPLRWLQAISKYQADTSGGPNFGYDLCVSKIAPEDCQTLDLSHWSIAYSGAEPVRAETIKRFTEKFAPFGFRPEAFYPCYGLAEATLFVTGGPKTRLPVTRAFDEAALEHNRVIVVSDEDGQKTKDEGRRTRDPGPNPESQIPNPNNHRSLVSCGPTWLDQQIKIVDPDALTESRPEHIGEIWISGPNVTQGYWNRPDQTQHSFQAYIADTHAGPFLRTGDLGFLHDGELFVTGRIKDLIIIRGRNHYPQDIELTVETSHPALQPGAGAAFSVDVNGEEQLVVVQEIKRDFRRAFDAAEVLAAVRTAIAENHQFQVQAIVLIKPLGIPKTSSGKIQRQACRANYLEGSLEVIEAWESPVEVRLDEGRTTEDGGKADELIAWLRYYADHRLNSQLMDERRTIPPYVVLDFGNQGLLGMQVPADSGGLGLNTFDTLRIIQQLGAIDQTLALFVGLNNILGIRPILKYGTPALRGELLPILAAGRELGAFALTEPSAGSNPQASLARAVPAERGEGWRLSGTKIWSGSAAWAGVINVFAQQLDDSGNSKGISAFVVRQGSPGLRHGPEALTMGMRGMIQNTVYLENVFVGPDQLLGEPGAGMETAQDAMMYGRLAIGAASVGGMKRCAQLMLRYAERRSISTGRLLNNPVTLARLSNLTHAITAVDSLVTCIAQTLDRGDSVPVEAYTACKIAGPEFFWQAADTLVQMLGGRGYIESNSAPQLLRDARILRIFEGPTETLTLFLGSRVMHHPNELRQFLCDQLNVPATFDQLVEAAEQIKQRCVGHTSPFGDLTAGRQWAYRLIGELATFAVLLATVRQAFDQAPSAERPQAVEWAQAHFEQKIKAALAGISEEFALSDAATLSRVITRYTQTIGDLEQTLPGADYELDALLRRSRNGSDGTPAPESNTLTDAPKVAVARPGFAERAGGMPSQNARGDAGFEQLVIRPVAVSKHLNAPSPELTHTFESLENWISHWVARQFNLPVGQVDVNRPFAEYGMDSVAAVEFAFELETWLGNNIKLGETIAWNCPTIAALTHYLARELNVSLPALPLRREASLQPQPILGGALEPSADLDSFSEAELARLLAEEIALAQQRGMK